MSCDHSKNQKTIPDSRLNHAARSHLWLPGTNALSRTLASHPESHCLGSGVLDERV